MTTTAYQRPVARTGVDLFLDANEGPAPGPGVLEAALVDAGASIRRYPDAAELERKIAGRLGVDPARVLVTAGADDGIDRCCRTALRPGTSLLMPLPGFEMFERHARLSGARVLEYDWTGGTLPVGEILDRVEPDTTAIAVISPNNPTGLVARAEEVRRLAGALPDRLVIVDAAYAEFADEDLTPLASELSNVVVLRSFSKAWGLAGARVGYAVGPQPWIDRLRSGGQPYAVAGPSLRVALAALERGEERMRAFVREVRAERGQLRADLEALGASPTTSQANFVLARFEDANRVWEDLQALGIAVRRWADRPSLDGCLRIGCPGDARDFARLRSALRTSLRPEAILFDLDGVLADESRSYRAAILETCRSFGVPTDREEIRALKQSGGFNNDWDVTHRIVTRAGIDARYEDVVARFEELYHGDASRPGLNERETLLVDPALLRALARPYRLGVVTGRPRRDALEFLERFGLVELFGAIVTLDDAAPKPDPEPVRRALGLLGVESAWMIGDNPDDARAARSAGVLPLGILPPNADDAVPASGLIAAGCARVLERLTDLQEMLP